MHVTKCIDSLAFLQATLSSAAKCDLQTLLNEFHINLFLLLSFVIKPKLLPPFRIHGLPGELRNNIYNIVPLSDKMTWVRVLRSSNTDVSLLSYKEATCQTLINVHYPSLNTKHPINRPSPQHIKDKIQNIDVYWVLYGPGVRKEVDVEALSWDPRVSRGLSSIFFGWYPGEPSSPMPFGDSDFGPLKTLAGFETVELRVGLKTLGRL